MSAPPADGTARYELRVATHLGPQWSAWFDGFTLTHHRDGTTSLRGTVSDQSELHGLLAKVRDLGVTLISVTPVAETDDDTAGSHSPERRTR